MNLDFIHSFLTTSYWANGISKELVARSIQRSLCFGIFTSSNQQCGFARVITDFATFAYLADVFVITEHRDKGLSKWLIQTIVDDPKLQGVSNFLLATKDAHSLYEKYQFKPLLNPQWYLKMRKENSV